MSRITKYIEREWQDARRLSHWRLHSLITTVNGGWLCRRLGRQRASLFTFLALSFMLIQRNMLKARKTSEIP